MGVALVVAPKPEEIAAAVGDEALLRRGVESEWSGWLGDGAALPADASTLFYVLVDISLCCL